MLECAENPVRLPARIVDARTGVPQHPVCSKSATEVEEAIPPHSYTAAPERAQPLRYARFIDSFSRARPKENLTGRAPDGAECSAAPKTPPGRVMDNTANDATPACLVTGCAGFVGSHLCEALLGKGCPVVGLDDRSSGRFENMAGFDGRPDFAFYERSILEPGLLDDLKTRHPSLDKIFHLAAIVSAPYSINHAEETFEVNQLATARLHQAAKRLGCGVFVFAGSAAEYGDEVRQPLREEYADATRRLSPYGEAKYQASKALERSGYGVSLRFFNIYGPRQDPKSPYSGVISRFIDAVRAGRPMTIFGDGSQTRDFIHVEDAVRCYLLAAGLSGSHEPLRGIFNAGSQTAVSVAELAGLVARIAGVSFQAEFLPPRPGDILHSLADASKLAQATGFTPKISLVEGLTSLLSL